MTTHMTAKLARVFRSGWTGTWLLGLSVSGCSGKDLVDPAATAKLAVTESSTGCSSSSVIVGTKGDDYIVGTNKDDCIYGLGGNDTLEGGNGSDTIFGGDGNDAVSGGNGADVIEGGGGNDSISGDNAADVLRGGAGDDIIAAGAGSDTLQGGGDDDVLLGENGADAADGEAGNDVIIGGNGADTLQGGTGNDVILGGNAEDVMDGGTGIDACDALSCEIPTSSSESCSETLACPTGQTCVTAAGVCLRCWSDAECGDGNVCTDDQCLPTLGCTYPAVADGSPCDDGNACLQTDACVAGVCRGDNPVVCLAQDQCHEPGTCDPSSGLCSNPASDNQKPCNDANACTQTDVCSDGTCIGSNPIVCTALDQCHSAGVCDPEGGSCSNPTAADGAVCSDGDSCTNDSCVAGVCLGVPLDCDDGNACSSDYCGDGLCQHLGNGTCTGPLRFVESGGLVVMEAENADTNTPQGNYRWDRLDDPTFSSAMGMVVSPATPSVTYEASAALTSAPRLDYQVTFGGAAAYPADYRVYVRGYADVSAHDSCHVGIDGSPSSTASRLSWLNNFGKVYWTNKYSSTVATITVPTPGAHTVSIWMREPGLKIDKIVILPKTSATVPSGSGPEETRGPTCDGFGNNFPENAEVCDGLDNDCNGQADFPGELSDADGDGYLACTDCDDSNRNVYPGHVEICDGRDNDCDTVASFPGETIDADGDGSASCADCNDADPRNFPGNRETCDGLDNDCNGLADADVAGEVDIDNDSIRSCVDCDDHDPINQVTVNFLVHGPMCSPDVMATPRLLGSAAIGDVALTSLAAPFTWQTSLTLPQHTTATYRYARTDDTATVEVGPWGEALAARDLKVECSNLTVEDAVWNWDDLTIDTQGNALPTSETDKGPTVSTFGTSSTQVTITVHLPTAQDVSLRWGTQSGACINLMTGTGQAHYEFSLTNLVPGTTYYYYVEYAGQITSEYRFTTSSGTATPFRFVAYGDSQDDDADLAPAERHVAHRRIVAQAYGYHPSVVIRTGDLVSTSTDANQWSYFFAIERPVLSSALYLPVQGNHDTGGTNFFTYFALPPTPNAERYFAVQYNNTLFIGLSTEAGTSTITGAEKTWLSNTLSAAKNDPSITWKIAYFHQPFYSSGEHGGNFTVRNAWESLFTTYGVNVVFSGHDHDYERLTVNGIQYLVIGGGGSDLREFSNIQPSSVYREKTHHLVVVDVDGRELIANTYRVDGTRMDGFTLAAP